MKGYTPGRAMPIVNMCYVMHLLLFLCVLTQSSSRFHAQASSAAQGFVTGQGLS